MKKILWLLLVAFTLQCTQSQTASERTNNGSETLLIGNVNLVDVENGEIIPNQFVTISGKVIESISNQKPAGEFSETIDGSGKYLMPGLINMYTHVNEDNLLLYLSNGQTTVKDSPSHLTALGLKKKTESGELLGPRIFAVGLRATGMPAPYHSQQPTVTPEATIEQMREAKRLGYDGMFIYATCDPETYLPLLEEAEKIGFHISGHFPQYVSLQNALKGGQKSFDNMTGLTSGGNLRVDKDSLIAGLIRTGQALTPTLAVHRLWSLSNKNDSIYDAIPKEYIPNKMKVNWLPVNNGSGSYPYEQVASLIKELYDKGIPIYIGSDGGYPMVVNGFAYHDEIENFSRMGIPNAKILRIATINSAQFLDYENLGLIKEGYIADLLLLDRNPLDNLENLKSINHVFVNGRPVSRSYLDNQLQQLKARLESTPNRFENWQNEIQQWANDSVLNYSLRVNDLEVGQERIRIEQLDSRNYNLTSINVMDGPDGRETYTHVRVTNRKVDSLFTRTISPEGEYTSTISTAKAKAIIEGTAPFHGYFHYEQDLEAGTLLLGPFTSRYFDLDIAFNYLQAIIQKRFIQPGQADQLPVIQIELNSEEFGKNLIVDNSGFTVFRESDNQYKVIYHGFSGYRSLTRPSFGVDVQIGENGLPISMSEGKVSIVYIPNDQ